MTNKIIEAARLAGQYADAEYRRAWEEASDGASWQQNRDARFYAIVRAEALEDAAKAVKSLTAEIRFQAVEHYKFADAAEKTILALKEQQHG